MELSIWGAYLVLGGLLVTLISVNLLVYLNAERIEGWIAKYRRNHNS